MPRLVQDLLRMFANLVRFLICLVSYPVRLLAWFHEAITGQRRRFRKQRKAFEERAPLSDSAFLEKVHVRSDLEPVWRATRKAVADCCRLPNTVIYPSDNLDALRSMMAPGPDANWADPGADWAVVAGFLQETLEIAIPLDEIEAAWAERRLRGELKTLHQFTTLVASIINNHYDIEHLPTSSTNMPEGIP